MNLKEQKAKLAGLLTELKTAEEELQKGGVKKERRDEISAKFEEAKGLQEEIDQAEGIISFNGKMREVPDPVLPATERKDAKGKGVKGADGTEIVGYISLGDAFTQSEAFKNYVKGGMSRNSRPSVQFVKGIREPVLEVTRKMVEQKAVPSFDTGVIRPDRTPLVVQETADDRTVLRDVLNISQTDAASVEYVIEDEYTPAADVVAEGTAKPEATTSYSLGTAPVRTLAVHMPVTEQQLSDVPQIRNLIDNRLTYDLRKLEEKQIMYGSGIGQNLTGILPLSSVQLITRSAPSDTQNLDRVRIGITDILVSGYEPNALVIHPYDWEGIVLLKESTKGYIWTIVTDPQTGNSRVWGLRVVESVAAKNPASAQRYMLVGDFRRGATLWDRQQATVEVGWIDDQFILNMRTIRAEERVAFGVHAPKAFAKYETNAA